MEEEIWADLPYQNFAKDYKISSFGRVMSLNRNHWRGFKETTKKNLILKHTAHKFGYLYVCCTSSGVGRSLSIHRMVALAFIKNPNPSEYTEVDHIDFNPQNNNANNLQWVSPKMNVRRTREAGRYFIKRGESHGMAKLTECEIIEIRKLYSTHKYYQRELAKKYKIGRTAIAKIVGNKTWRHIDTLMGNVP